MPLLPFLPLIGAGVNAIGGLLGQSQTNTMQRDMMLKQREWALEDWNRQNAYNAPSAQMQRFKDAGLNPNLIYGQSNVAQPVRSTQSADVKAPDYGQIGAAMTQGLFGYMDLRKRELENDRLKNLIELAKSQVANLDIKSDYTKFRQQFESELAPYQVGYADIRNTNMLKQNLKLDYDIDKVKADVLKTKADTLYTTNQDKRADRMVNLAVSKFGLEKEKFRLEQSKTEQQLKESAQRIINMMNVNSNNIMQKLVMERNLENMYKEGKLKDALIELNSTRNETEKVRASTEIFKGILGIRK